LLQHQRFGNPLLGVEKAANAGTSGFASERYDRWNVLSETQAHPETGKRNHKEN
jgi:hypothetical protein